RVLETLLRSPRVRCIELSGQAPAVRGSEADESAQRDAPYLNLTREIGRTCNLLLAIWDGSPSALTGGTADTVLRYLGMRTERNSHEVSVVLTDAPADQQPPFRLVYWVPAARVSQSPPRGEQPCFLSGLGDNVLQRWRGMPKQLASQLDELNAYNREYRQVARDARKRRAPDSLARTLPKDAPVPHATRAMLARIDAEYGKADALAMYYQRRSDRLFTFFSLMAFVMGLAYLAYERFIQVRMLLFVYLLVLFSSLGLYYLLHGRRWFAKHLMCRALAETLRAKFYLHFAGADRLVDAEAVISLSGIDRFHGFSWIGHVLTSVEGPPQSAAERGDTQDCCVDDVDTAWIESQRKYFVSKVARLERASRRTKHLQQSLFVVIMLVVVSLIALGDVAERVRFGFGISLEN